MPAADPQPAPPKLALSRKPAGTSSSGSNTPYAHLSSDEGSASSTDEEERKKRFQSAPKNNRFLEMKKQRPALREKYIQEGILPDPLKPQQLSDAAKFRGNCMEMCPEFEREEREFQGEGDELEVFPGTTKLDPAIAVKIYRRPAAGRELPLPEDVRPPEVLRQTLDYLLHKVVPRSPDSDRLANVQGFVWNRTRAIRQDFIVQGEAGPLTIECHERIARWHILSLHWRGGSVDGQGKERDSWPADRDPWSKQQELEQLAKTLTSLNEFYDDLRLTTGEEAPSPNEAEFRAYHLILNIFDPEVLRVVELLPEPVFDAPILQTAIRMRSYAQRSNRGGSSRANALNTDAPMNFFSRFFAEIKSPQVPYLLACMLENQFSQVREGALKALSANYNKVHRGPTLSFVKEALGADSEQEVARWAEECDIEVLAPVAGSSDGSGAALKLHKQRDINFSKANLGSFSLALVEAKRGASTSQQIVDGGASYAAPQPSAGPASTGTLSSAMSFAPSALKPTPPQAAASSSAFGSTTAKLSPFAAAFQPKGADSSQAPSQQPSASTPSFFAPSTAPAPAAPANKEAFFQPSTSGFSFTKPETAPAAGPSKTTSFGGSAFGSSSAWQPTTQQPQPQPQPPPQPKAFSSPAPAPQAAPAPSPFAPGPAPSTNKRSQPDDAFAPPPPKAKSPPRAPVKTASTKEISAKLQRRLLDEVVASQSQKIGQEALAAEVKRRHTIARGDILDSLAQRLLNQLIAGEEDGERDESEPAAVRKLATEAAQEAFAVEWCRRTTLRVKLDRWATKMEMKREEQRQRARFEYVRQRVRERGLIATPASRGDEVSRGGGMRSVILGPGGGSMDSISTAASTSLSSTSASLLSRSRPLSMSLPLPRAGSKRPYEDEDEDEDMDVVNEEDSQLRRSFIRFETQRTHLWAEGTFFASIAGHVADLASRWRPTGMAVWNVALVDGSDESASQQWLKHKFGFPQSSSDTERSIHVARDLAVQAQLLEIEGDEEGEGSDVAMMDRCHPLTGLVIFPLSPALASKNLSHKEAVRLWGQEAERLKRLVSTSSQGPLWGNRFAPYLLVLDWAADRRGGARETLSRLGISSASATPWKAPVNVVSLGGQEASAAGGDIDALFSRAVSRSVKDFPLLRHPLGTGFARRNGGGALAEGVVTTLEELVATVQRPWDEALVGVEALLARMPTHQTPSSSALIRAAIESVTTLLAMANHGISALVNNAETLFEEGEEDVEEVLFLPRPDVDAFVARLPTGREVAVDEALRRLGREVVKELVARDERNEVARGGDDEHGNATENVSRSGPSGGLLMAQAILSSPSSSSSSPFPLTTFLSSLTASRLELLAEQYFLCVRADEDGSHKSKERVEAEAGRMAQWGKRAVSILEGKIREATKDGHVVGGGGGGKRRTSSLGVASGRTVAGSGKVQRRARQQQGTDEGGSDSRGGEEDFAPSGDVAKLRRLIASANSLLSSASSS